MTHNKDQNSDDLYACRVCGLYQDDPPWGEDGQISTYNICACCGTEFGYEDMTVESTLRARAQWLAGGAVWCDPPYRPDHWSLEGQLAQIPDRFLAIKEA